MAGSKQEPASSDDHRRKWAEDFVPPLRVSSVLINGSQRVSAGKKVVYDVSPEEGRLKIARHVSAGT
jgi:hypothetical protein